MSTMDKLNYFNRAGCPAVEELTEFEIEGLALHILSTVELDGLEVLSLGCGNGRIEQRLLHRSKPRGLTCLDYSERYLLEARHRVKGAKFVSMDLNVFEREKLSTYDLIYEASIAQYFTVEELRALHRNLLGCLKPGGRLIHFNVPDERRALLYRINNAIVMEDWAYLLSERDFIDDFSRWCAREEFYAEGYSTSFRTPSYQWERFDAILQPYF